MSALVNQTVYNTLNGGNIATQPLEDGIYTKQIIGRVLNNWIRDNCDEILEAGITLDDTIQQQRQAFHTIISRAGYKTATVDNQLTKTVVTLVSNISTALTGNTRQMADPVSLQHGDFFNFFIDVANTQPIKITYGSIANEIPLWIKQNNIWQNSVANTFETGYYAIACIDGYAPINSGNKTFILINSSNFNPVNADWNSTFGISQILNKPNLVASATTDTTNASNISSGTLNKDRLPSTLNSFTVAKENTNNEGGQITFALPDTIGTVAIDVLKDIPNNLYRHRFLSVITGGGYDAFGLEYNSNGLLIQVYTALPKILSPAIFGTANTLGYYYEIDGRLVNYGKLNFDDILTDSMQTIIFPASFPSGILDIQATVVANDGVLNPSTVVVAIKSFTNAQVIINCREVTPVLQNVSVFWRATGY